jgi:uncharacterized protein (DUF362 family)
VRPQVGIAYTPDYASVHSTLDYGMKLIGGITDLVRGKTVTVKVNLTGWGQSVFDKPATESYVVHGNVASGLVSLLLGAGARRVVIVESAPTLDDLGAFAARLGWDVVAMQRLGAVEFTNTRSGGGKPYATLAVPNGRLFTRFDVHRAYAETDVFVSLAKMKNHRVAGVTLGMKNVFGMPPNALYGVDAPSEEAVGTRVLIHDRRGSDAPLLPGEMPVLGDQPPTVRVPRTVVDICAARPVHLTVIDGVQTMAGGEGPWSESSGELQLVRPDVVIVGRDPVATDAVAVAVMGYEDPLTTVKPPFHFGENHIRIAHEARLGIGDLTGIDVRGMTIAQARTPFAWL